ncbi:hypothetical protein BO71DRAFT_401537 [Aspergillus ellipticus CBS 707.79]|uniref:Initiation-specific alpha-1,6-mannosyltransferase n=1 Tax=Aspergillus ellipticus CBS 707.79 TaxID=1448320 RepID=A0A319D1R6_9EURO|nr:hypothetical protein BO71DRAFT_401537 [Aspergillus ellipticus CBS 707.79]
MSILLTNRPTAALLSALLLLNFYLFHRLLRQPVIDLPTTTTTTTITTTTAFTPVILTTSSTHSPTTTTTTTTPVSDPPSEPTTTTTTASILPEPTTSQTPTPTPTPTGIPLKLWQKAGPRGLIPPTPEYISTWTTLNPTLRHEILTDGSSAAYVTNAYASLWPEVSLLYEAIQVPIVKADLLRLLILYADGGIWSDLDVGCDRAVEEWGVLETGRNDGEVSVVVGLEFDGWQFASWTVMAAAGSVHVRAAIEYVMGQMGRIAAEHNVTVEGVTMEMIPDVVDASGPQAMTVAILQSLSRELGETVGRANISQVREPTLLGDVLVLPQAAFAARQGGYPTDQGPYLVSHHYAGSWKNEQGGE